jgi:hypothetical protein
MSQGKTREEALANIKDAVQACLKVMDGRYDDERCKIGAVSFCGPRGLSRLSCSELVEELKGQDHGGTEG